MAESSLFASDDEFRRWLDREIKFTEKLARELKPTEIAPRLVVVGREGEGKPRAVRLVAFATGLDEDSKHETFAAIGAQFYCNERFVPLAAYFTSESWISRQRVGSPQLQPSRDPARTEAITVAGRTIDGKDALALAEIHRGTGDVITLGKFETAFARTESVLLRSFFDGFLRADFLDLKGKRQ